MRRNKTPRRYWGIFMRKSSRKVNKLLVKGESVEGTSLIIEISQRDRCENFLYKLLSFGENFFSDGFFEFLEKGWSPSYKKKWIFAEIAKIFYVHFFLLYVLNDFLTPKSGMTGATKGQNTMAWRFFFQVYLLKRQNSWNKCTSTLILHYNRNEKEQIAFFENSFQEMYFLVIKRWWQFLDGFFLNFVSLHANLRNLFGQFYINNVSILKLQIWCKRKLSKVKMYFNSRPA